MEPTYPYDRYVIIEWPLGANHIPKENPLQLTQNLKAMYNEIRKMFPSTLIYNSAMIPRLENGVLYALNRINDEVASHCHSLKIKTIRYPQFGTHEINFNYLKHDTIHPTFTGTSIMAKNIIAVYRNYNQSQRT